MKNEVAILLRNEKLVTSDSDESLIVGTR